jgi:hypothetical protein
MTRLMTTSPPGSSMPVISDQERLFQVYLAMGPGRSHNKLQKLVSEDPQKYGLAYSPSLRNIKEWSSWGQWSRRIRDPESMEREKAERQRLERIQEHRERLHRRGLQLQERGDELLRGLPGNGVKLKEAVDAIDTGLRYEALSLMSLDDHGTQLALSEEQLQRLTDSDVKTIIRLLRKATGDTPEKPRKWPKMPELIVLPWQHDYNKMMTMTAAEKAAYRRKVQAERRARGMPT